MTTAARTARLSAAAVLIFAVVWLFLPSSLGGSTTYVSTYGDSMEPGFRTGDLALLRPAGGYGVGDVVAFDSAELGTTVMHRIVDLENGRYITQGDNNTWLDEDRTGRDDVLGKLWLHVPQGGRAITALRDPAVLVLVGLAIGLILVSLRRPAGRGRRRSGHRAARRAPLRDALRGTFGGSRSVPAFATAFPTTLSAPVRLRARQVAIGSGILAAVAAAGVVVLDAQPATQVETREIALTHSGRYDYDGTARTGTTYPSGRVVTGDPIWTSLVDDVSVSLDTTVRGGELQGTVRLAVRVAAPDGWSSQLLLGEPVALRDGTARASVALDSDAAAALLERHHAEVGTPAGGATLSVRPVVDATATLDGRPVDVPELPDLAFAMDGVSLRPAGDVAALAPTAETSTTVDSVVPRSFDVLGVAVPAPAARSAAVALLVLALLTAPVAGWIGRRAPQQQPATRSRARTVPVAAFDPDGVVVDVADVDALHRVAERLDGLLLHAAGDDADTFAVRDGATTYRCVVPHRDEVPAPARRVTGIPLFGRFA